MERWLQLIDNGLVARGRYFRADLETDNGSPVSDSGDFIAELAKRVMDYYESRPLATLPALSRFGVVATPPTRTKRHYRALFDSVGGHTEAFRTVASEVFTVWAEERFAGVHYARANPPLGSEPGFDVLSVYAKPNGDWTIRLAQTKATRENCVARSNEALDGFAKLEAGRYDAQLLARLTLFAEIGKIPDHIDLSDFVFPENRSYCVFLLHAEDLTNRRLMTTYDAKVVGPDDRRTSVLVTLGNWETFWTSLGEAVHAQLV